MPRIHKRFHYIYKTTCNVTKRFYYGMHSTDNLNDGYLGSGQRLWKSINKYGRENHSIEIIEYYNNRESLKAREKELVNEDMLKDPMCMNLKPGGYGGFNNDEHRKKTSDLGTKRFQEKIKNDLDFKENFKNKCSIATKEKWKDDDYRKNILSKINWKGKHHSEETKEKLRISKNVGENNPQYGTCWINKDDTLKKIKKEELQNYLDKGWNKGSKFNRYKHDDVIKICQNCGKEFTIGYNKRHQICCSRKCASSFKKT